MDEKIFRKKSIDRVSSPEQLNEYIRVSNPGVWMILGAVVLLLVGAIVWGVLGHIDTTVDAVAVSDNGEVLLYVKEEQIKDVCVGQTVRFDDTQATILEISAEPVAVNEDFSDYVCYVGELHSGEWVYVLRISGEIEQGVYSAQIVVESISPISFVLN